MKQDPGLNQPSFSRQLFLAAAENLGSLVLLLIAIAVFSGLMVFVIGNSSLEQFLKVHDAAQFADPRDPTLKNAGMAVASIVLGCFAFIPVMALYAANDIVFGPLWGSLFSLLGIIVAAAAQYLFGRLFQKAVVRKNPAGLVPVISERFSRAGIWPFALMRIVPLAPFTVMNLIVGALKVNFSNFMLGNILGSLLPIGLAALFAFEFERIAPTQHLRVFVVAVLVLAFITFIALRGLWALLKRRRASFNPST